jgi:hypothetical protein
MQSTGQGAESGQGVVPVSAGQGFPPCLARVTIERMLTLLVSPVVSYSTVSAVQYVLILLVSPVVSYSMSAVQ